VIEHPEMDEKECSTCEHCDVVFLLHAVHYSLCRACFADAKGDHDYDTCKDDAMIEDV
jgi:hypothetical protein